MSGAEAPRGAHSGGDGGGDSGGGGSARGAPKGATVPSSGMAHATAGAGSEARAGGDAAAVAASDAKAVSAAAWVKHMRELLELEREAEIEEAVEATRAPGKELEARGVALLSVVIGEISTGLFGRTMVKLVSRGGGLLPANRFSAGDIVSLSNAKSGGAAGASVGGGLVMSTAERGSGGKRRGPAIEYEMSGIVSRSTDTTLTVALDEDGPDVESLPPSIRVDLLANDATHRRVMEGLARLEKGDGVGEGRLIQVMFGLERPRFAPLTPLTPFNKGLNASQTEAVRVALAAKDIMLIHGPPGTGKTTTVVELIRQAVERGDKVLACAPSNVAVDNLVERLAVRVPGSAPRILRIGHPARVTPAVLKHCLDARIQAADGTSIVADIRREIATIDKQVKKERDRSVRTGYRMQQRALRKEIRTREYAVVRDIIRSAHVVLATTSGAASRIIARAMAPSRPGGAGAGSGGAMMGHNSSIGEAQLHFDLCVIDEVAQSTEASCWIPMLQAPKAVLAGDHCQLPPTIKSDEAARGGLAVTLADRVVRRFGDSAAASGGGESAVRMLEEQFRMHADIMQWSSDAMYSGRLTAHTSVAEHTLADLEHVAAASAAKAAGSGGDDGGDSIVSQRMVLVDSAGCEFIELQDATTLSKANPDEAEVVAKYVRQLLDAGVRQSEIAVISPYNAQVHLLRNLLLGDYPRLEIRSVDGFQGQEKEAVVISLVRSNSAHEVGFLRDHRRMNVAVTRARRHVAIIGDSETVSADPFLKGLVEYVEAHGEVMPADAYLEDAFVGAAGDGGSDGRAGAGGAEEGAASVLGSTGAAIDAAAAATAAAAARTEAQERMRARLTTSSANTVRPSAAAAKAARRKRAAPPRQSPAVRKAALAAQVDAHFGPATPSATSPPPAPSAGTNPDVLAFPVSLNGFDRMLLHEVADARGLQHKSFGDDTSGNKGRYVVLGRKGATLAGVPPAPEPSKAAPKAKVGPPALPAPVDSAGGGASGGAADTRAGTTNANSETPDVSSKTAHTDGKGVEATPGDRTPGAVDSTATAEVDTDTSGGTVSASGGGGLLAELHAERMARAAAKGESSGAGGAAAAAQTPAPGKGKGKNKRKGKGKKKNGGATQTPAAGKDSATHGGLASGAVRDLESIMASAGISPAATAGAGDSAAGSGGGGKGKGKGGGGASGGGASGAGGEDGDFDDLALLDAVLAASKLCSKKGCRIKISISGSTCSECNLKFCYEHGQPEVHGCGAKARVAAKAAHAKAFKNTGPRSSVAVPSDGKTLKGWKRNSVSSALAKKIEEKASARKAKATGKKTKKK